MVRKYVRRRPVCAAVVTASLRVISRPRYTSTMKLTIDQLWHGTFKRPYRLVKTHDHGSGPGVVLLHGIGRSGRVWQSVSDLLTMAEPACRVVAYDLLGFGASPKPTWLDYTVDDHAGAVIAEISRLRGSVPVLLVGHSMGCLVAVRIASLRPDLVRHLVLYEMPLYEGLPEKWRYKTRISTYFQFYDWVIRQNPTFDDADKRFRQRIMTRVVGSELTSETWQPFIKSLKNTIMAQSAAKDLPSLTMPADIIYGSRDMFVIKGTVQKTLGLDSKMVTTHTISERHVLSENASNFIAERVTAALTLSQTNL
jgi:pimeloyl-ACP methyl ester carboxylesterase